MHPRYRRVALAVATVLLASATSAASVPTADAGPTRTAEVGASFPVELRVRIAAAAEYAKLRPGFAGIVVRDRATGAVWRSGHSDTHVWACSTPKLAMVVDLLLRDDAGAIELTDQDRALMHAMLYSSDNDAAHTLWNRYGGEDFATRFPDYGMTDMRFTDDHPHHWGWIRTTADDLDRLTTFALERMPAAHRDYLVRELRGVHPNQQWGVWGAGAAAKPGNKNGWCDDNDDGSWLMNSVGFAGPGQRYTLAIMNNTRVVENGDDVGRETTTRIAAILFRGYVD